MNKKSPSPDNFSPLSQDTCETHLNVGPNTNKMVRVRYRGFFDDGSTFIDQSEPIEFPCCEGWMPPVFIEQVAFMRPGETRTTRVSAQEAYEESRPDRIIKVSRDSFADRQLKTPLGELVNLEAPDGQTYPARLIEITEDEFVFDMNHEAICKALNFEITLLDVRELSDC